MNLSELKNDIRSLRSHILFKYNNMDCGIDPLSVNHFDMWYGGKYHKATSIDEVMNIKLFDGKSLTEIFEKIEDLDY